MTGPDDYPDEMRKPRPLDDRSVEDFLTGRTVPGEELLNSFSQSLRAVTSDPAPVPRGDLARLLVDGLTIDKGDLPVTAASKAPGPRAEASGLPKWRRPLVATSSFVTAVLAKAGVASAAAKTGVVAALAAGAMTAAGAAGALPAPVQNALSHAVSDVTSIHLPTDTNAPSTTRTHGAPTNPGSRSSTGLDQANSTPAAGHARTSVPTPADPGSRSGTSGQGGGQAGTADAGGTPAGGQPASPGSNGLARANSTPAAGHAPTATPAATGQSHSSNPGTPPASPGSQGTTGLNRANSTPAAGHAPASVPTPSNPGSQAGSSTGGSGSQAPTHPAGSSTAGGSTTGDSITGTGTGGSASNPSSAPASGASAGHVPAGVQLPSAAASR